MLMVQKSRKAKVAKRRAGLGPFHPIIQAQIIREPKPSTPLMDFIRSVEGEVEYLDALREFQEEWCEHPKPQQTVISVLSQPQHEIHRHVLRCEDCGKHRERSGRPSGSRRS